MREKIARKLYELASVERDTSIAEYSLDLKKSWPWDKLKESSKEYWKQIASQILEAICEEIEKVENPSEEGGLSDFYFRGFEACRQKILALLRAKEG